ncbi:MULTISPECIES: immunity 49 family protein [unclassified Nocardiopsis]|uniref:immunity 49 family protein n=1 Tax=unclassified Nocardiopsis TaxID=2649073 RepID=UPI00135A25DF|nr:MULTISPECIES: immunity 49 family protein [unclassified Nocardiopsis]
MTIHVSRAAIDHGVDQDFLDSENQYRDELVQGLEQDCSNMDLDLSPVYGAAEMALLLDPEAAKVETWEAWTIAMQFHNAVFALSEVEQGTEVEYRIGHEFRKLTSPGMLNCADPATWEKAFFLAAVCRDNERAQALCRVPVERMREAARNAQVEYNDYLYHWVAALQAFVNGTDDLASELRRAMELSDPRGGAFGGGALDLLVFPKMEVFRQLLLGDSAKFNEALVYALECYKRYHTSQEDQNRVSGIVPLALLAFACLAYDKAERTPGFSLDVESEYLPKHLVKRSWYGEFPV